MKCIYQFRNTTLCYVIEVLDIFQRPTPNYVSKNCVSRLVCQMYYFYLFIINVLKTGCGIITNKRIKCLLFVLSLLI